MAKILITDDAAFMRAVIKGALDKEGHEFVEATNGIEMLEKYKSEKPDLVTLDITMPEMDGLTALKELRKLDPKARVIMCTAMGQQTMVMDAIQSGAIDFLVKPFNSERIIEAVRKVVNK